MTERRLLVHYHIYKNAGSSIEKNLQDIFGERWTSFEGVRNFFRVTSDDIAEFAAGRPELLAISSHRARPTPHYPNFCPILLLRHPIDRARSIYHFARRDPGQHDHAVASNGSFRDYIRWSLTTPGFGVVVRNYQVIHLSQASFRTDRIQEATATPADLDEVLALLEAMPFFGLVRRFDETCLGYTRIYQSIWPGFVMRPVIANASTDQQLGEDESVRIARDELGMEWFDRLIDANRLDMKLYEAASDMFERRLAGLSP